MLFIGIFIAIVLRDIIYNKGKDMRFVASCLLILVLGTIILLIAAIGSISPNNKKQK